MALITLPGRCCPCAAGDRAWPKCRWAASMPP